jgi:hypothetical protein
VTARVKARAARDMAAVSLVAEPEVVLRARSAPASGLSRAMKSTISARSCAADSAQTALMRRHDERRIGRDSTSSAVVY